MIQEMEGNNMHNIIASAASAMRSLPALLTDTTVATLELNFDPGQMFAYTNVITGSMMPLVYISAGFSLGFTIIYALKNAFSGGVRL